MTAQAHDTVTAAKPPLKKDAAMAGRDPAIPGRDVAMPPPSPRSRRDERLGWLKLTVCLWLLRKMVKLAGWLLLAAVAVAAWPVTLGRPPGTSRRGWRLAPGPASRAAAACLLPVTAVWLVAEAIRRPAWQAVALAPARDRGTAGMTSPAAARPGRSCWWPPPRSRPGSGWPRWHGRGGITR